jgi:hypothetical protein
MSKENYREESYRQKIVSLADDSCLASWESIARELIDQMSEQDAEDFYDYFMANCV